MAQKVRIGINGFGRIGRKVARLALQDPRVELVGVNDLSNLETLAHLFKHDSVHGRLPHAVTVEGSALIVDGQRIPFFQERDPKNIPWTETDAQIVHECTGVFRDKPSASAHLGKSVKRVIISAPAKNPDATLCYGVNHGVFDPAKDVVISNASCTTNCLAPLVKVIDQAFGVEKGTMLTVHSYTADQRLLDLPHSDLRRARAAAVSQIPTSTGAAKAVGEVLPPMKGKLDGLSIRVPTPDVSLVDFTCVVSKTTTAEAVNEALKTASQGPLKGVLGFSTEPLVSVDYYGDTRSSIVDAELTSVIEGNLVKVLSWYDNESGFSARMIDLSVYIAGESH